MVVAPEGYIVVVSYGKLLNGRVGYKSLRDTIQEPGFQLIQLKSVLELVLLTVLSLWIKICF